MSTITEIANKLIEETNCTTAEALEALEQSGGQYEGALIFLKEKSAKQPVNIVLIEEEDNREEAGNSESENKEEYKVNGEDILKLVKGLIRQGNVTKITIKKKGETILNIPVNAAAIGIVLAPYLSILAGIAAIATDATILVERNGGVVANVNDSLKTAGEKVEKTVKDIIDK